jgi:hypothetical protein
MRTSMWVFWALTVYFGLASIGYTIWGLLELGFIDWAGGTPFGLAALASALIAFYLRHARRNQGGTLPEDRREANIDDADPEMGHFSPYSWWPIVLAGGIFFAFLGFVAARWLAVFAVGLVVVALIGWVYQYYRGPYAR